MRMVITRKARDNILPYPTQREILWQPSLMELSYLRSLWSSCVVAVVYDAARRWPLDLFAWLKDCPDSDCFYRRSWIRSNWLIRDMNKGGFCVLKAEVIIARVWRMIDLKIMRQVIFKELHRRAAFAGLSCPAAEGGGTALEAPP